MNKVKKSFLLTILVTVAFFSCGDISDPLASYIIDEPYNFPLKPGTPEWANLETGIDKVDAVQIPQDIASRMTTRSLVETCLNYPLFHWVVADDSTVKKGMDKLIKQFNGFTELLKRRDAYIYLSEKFLSFDPLAVTNEGWGLLEKGDYMYELIKIELLLAQDIVLKPAIYKNKKSLLKEALLKYEKMLTQPEYYTLFDYEPLFLLMGKILQNSGKPDISSLVVKNKEIYNFLETGWIYDKYGFVNYNILNEILSIAKKVCS